MLVEIAPCYQIIFEKQINKVPFLLCYFKNQQTVSADAAAPTCAKLPFNFKL